MLVMDDLVKHIEWRTVLLERSLYGLYRHFDTGAKAAWFGENHFVDAHNIVSESGGIDLDCQLAERPGCQDGFSMERIFSAAICAPFNSTSGQNSGLASKREM